MKSDYEEKEVPQDKSNLNLQISANPVMRLMKMVNTLQKTAQAGTKTVALNNAPRK